MKTIEEAAKESATQSINKVFDKNGSVTRRHIMAFKKGVEFAQQWIPVEEEMPICIEDGVWDGLRSEYVLVKDIHDAWHKGILYSGILDGHKFNDWYDDRDFELINITYWRPIELR